MGIGSHQANVPAGQPLPGGLFGQRPEIAKQAAGGNLKEQSRLQPRQDQCRVCRKKPAPLRMCQDKLDAARGHLLKEARGIDVGLVRQLQQYVPPAVSQRHHFTLRQQCCKALIKPNVRTGCDPDRQVFDEQ